MSQQRTLCVVSWAMLVSAATLAWAPFAAGQQIMIQDARIGNVTSFEPSVSATQMKRLAEVLALNETQSTLADEFLREYHRVFREAAESVRQAMSEVQEEARATGDFSVFGEKFGPLMEDWERDRAALEREMIDNVRSLLSEEQMERWPLFEREKRRMELLPDSRLGGEDVDVILLVQEARAGTELPAEVRDLLEQYAVELDAALQARKRTIDGLQEDWRAALGGERERLEDIWNDATRKREAVRDVNERYARLIAQLLAESDKEGAAGEVDNDVDLWQLYLERAYPIAFEDTRAHRMIDSALELETLDDDARQAVEDVRRELEQRLEPLAHRLIAELVKEEAALPPFAQNVRMENAPGGGRAIGLTMTLGGAGAEEPYGGMLRERWEASEAAIARLKTALTPEVVADISGREEPAAQRVMLRGFRFNL